jgi:hypothetical protein
MAGYCQGWSVLVRGREGASARLERREAIFAAASAGAWMTWPVKLPSVFVEKTHRDRASHIRLFTTGRHTRCVDPDEGSGEINRGGKDSIKAEDLDKYG